MSAADADWAEANQRYLAAVLDRLKLAVGRVAGHDAAPPAQAPQALAAAMGRPPALLTLARAFGLSAFEGDLLALCAGVELDGALAALVGRAQGDPRAVAPTFSLAVAALPGAHWSALAPGAPLRRWRLLGVGAGPALTQSPLRVEERVLHYLAGVQQLDEGLAGLARQVRPADELLPAQQALAEGAAAAWAAQAGPAPALQLWGPEPEDLRAVAAAICARVGLGLWAIRADAIPAAPAAVAALARLWEREAALGGWALLIERATDDGTGAARAARGLTEELRGALLVAGPEPLRDLERPVASFALPRPTAAEQRLAWRAAVGAGAGRLNGQIDRLAAQFSLGASAILRAGRAAGAGGPPTDEALGEALWAAARAQARPRLDDLAQRVETAATWADLVLPEHQTALLRGVVAHVRQRAKVIDDWGLGAGGSRGFGVTALFAGPSGTGKTLAAEVLAGELRLDLYRIDLSQVVSKYIGETEKNLRQIFDAAERGGAVLLFDEADALFGKRSEVRDSHDRYANIEVSYLLQRMEQYRGLAVLTTNMRQALDGAFLRRLRFVVPFPFPDAAQRAAIWRRMYPAAVPTEGLDVERLAALSVAGGNIRNIALGAAFLAAEAGAPVSMGHLLAAARAEYAKLERTLPEPEVAGWA